MIDVGVRQLLDGFSKNSSILVVEIVTHYEAILEGNFPHSSAYKMWDNFSKTLHKFTVAYSVLYCFRFYIPIPLIADNLRKVIQYINLRADDKLVTLPTDVCTEAVRVNQFSLMGRPLISRNKIFEQSLPPYREIGVIGFDLWAYR